MLILGVNIGLCLLARLEITAEAWDKNLSLTTIAAFAIMVTIDIRRLNDIGISPWWLAPVWFLRQIPEPLVGSPQYGVYRLSVVMPLFLGLIYFI